MRATPRSSPLVVPASQFKAGDFPPICAMTGLPAETWRRFTFSRLRWSPVAILPVFGLLGHIALGAVDQPVRGKLPLTRDSNWRVGRAGWQGVLGIVIGGVCFAGIFVIGNAVGPHPFNAAESVVAGILVLAGLASLIGGGTFLFVATRISGPRGTVGMSRSLDGDRAVTIWNVHPAFAAAVQLRQSATLSAKQTP